MEKVKFIIKHSDDNKFLLRLELHLKLMADYISKNFKCQDSFDYCNVDN